MTVNKKIKEKRKDFNPNIKGDPAVNVKADEKGTSDVPATEQKDITPKEDGKNKKREEE